MNYDIKARQLRAFAMADHMFQRGDKAAEQYWLKEVKRYTEILQNQNQEQAN